MMLVNRVMAMKKWHGSVARGGADGEMLPGRSQLLVLAVGAGQGFASRITAGMRKWNAGSRWQFNERRIDAKKALNAWLAFFFGRIAEFCCGKHMAKSRDASLRRLCFNGAAALHRGKHVGRLAPLDQQARGFNGAAALHRGKPYQQRWVADRAALLQWGRGITPRKTSGRSARRHDDFFLLQWGRGITPRKTPATVRPTPPRPTGFNGAAALHRGKPLMRSHRRS